MFEHSYTMYSYIFEMEEIQSFSAGDNEFISPADAIFPGIDTT